MRFLPQGRRDASNPLAEPLEARRLLAVDATPLLAPYAGDQPEGALDGYIVYMSGGHGFAADGSLWRTGRPEYNEMVEDLGNQDQLRFYADYLWHAGATVVPLRPIGHQPNEVVLDNDDAGVSFSGGWSTSTASVYWGQAGDAAPYRYAAANATETAVATYRPNLPEAGVYPVYTWVVDGENRTDQLYQINHAGGTSEVRIDHRNVGKGWVYLGSYQFDAGTAGSVQISNERAGDGDVVIADGIRFGNGMGDIDRGSGVSGQTREDEASLYWLEAMVGQGTNFNDLRTIGPGDDNGANVGTLSIFAAHMNNAPFGQAIYLGFHSNGFNGAARGTLSLINTGTGGSTPNQSAWAQMTAREVNNDLIALTNDNDSYEHEWASRGTTLGSSYGEIRNDRFNGEMDATILEVAFHDNQLDAELMRDPKIRDAVGRASYQATVRYFNTYGTGDFVPTTMLPSPPQQVAVTTTDAGGLVVDWEPGQVDLMHGDAATGYTAWFDLGADGGFGLPIDVAAGQTSLHLSAAQLTSLGLSANAAIGVRVTASNAGGRSLPSRIVTALPGAATAPRVLLVDAFDRLERSQNVRQSTDLTYDPPANNNGVTIDRVRPALANTFDYSRAYGRAIAAYGGVDPRLDTVTNEQIANGTINLDAYDLVIWMAGEESTADETFSAAEQAVVSSYVNAGGKLFASGAELGWDLVAQGSASDQAFFNDTLKAGYVGDDAGGYGVLGDNDTIFDPLFFGFDDGQEIYDVDFPDRLAPINGSEQILVYRGNPGGTAGVAFADGSQRIVTLGFPFEAVIEERSRERLMASVLDYVDVAPPTPLLNEFFFQTSQTLVFRFDENVGAALDAGDLTLTNLTTGQTFPASGFTFTEDSPNIFGEGYGGEWTYDGILPDGNYVATIAAEEVTDAAGNALTADATLSFFVLAGDANRDRTVSLADFLILRANFGESNRTFQYGDFNYDDTVSLADFLILRGSFGESLPPPPSAAPMPSLFTGGKTDQDDDGGRARILA